MTPEIWGILNVTPDSFSDGGLYLEPGEAIARARQLLTDGASVIDVGAESTRPGAERVPMEEELRRLRPVVDALVAENITVSVDTMRAEVATEMVGRGALIVNDISGGLADPEMFGAVAALDCTYVVMHWRGHGATMDEQAHYDDVVEDVAEELTNRVDAAREAGIAQERLMLDPGFGFAKGVDHNWKLLQRLDHVVSLGSPVLIGVSRKRFTGAVLRGDHDPADRDGVSAVLSVLAAQAGVTAVRVHEPRVHAEALATWRAAKGGAAH